MAPSSLFGIDSTPRASGLRTPLLCAWVALALLTAALAPVHGHLPGDDHGSVLIEAEELTDACSLCSVPKVQQFVSDGSQAPALASTRGPLTPLAGLLRVPSGIARAHPPRAPPALS